MSDLEKNALKEENLDNVSGGTLKFESSNGRKKGHETWTANIYNDETGELLKTLTYNKTGKSKTEKQHLEDWKTKMWAEDAQLNNR